MNFSFQMYASICVTSPVIDNPLITSSNEAYFILILYIVYCVSSDAYFKAQKSLPPILYWLTFVFLHVLVDSVKSLETLEDNQIILISALVGGSVLLGAVLIVVACLCMNKYVNQHNFSAYSISHFFIAQYTFCDLQRSLYKQKVKIIRKF